jgi:hypothetical protein
MSSFPLPAFLLVLVIVIVIGIAPNIFEIQDAPLSVAALIGAFQSYCRDKRQHGPTYVDRLISAAQPVNLLVTSCHQLEDRPLGRKLRLGSFCQEILSAKRFPGCC